MSTIELIESNEAMELGKAKFRSVVELDVGKWAGERVLVLCYEFGDGGKVLVMSCKDGAVIALDLDTPVIMVGENTAITVRVI